MPLFWVNCCSVEKEWGLMRKLSRTEARLVGSFSLGRNTWNTWNTWNTRNTWNTVEHLKHCGRTVYWWRRYFFESPVILLRQYVKELAGKDNVSGGGRQDQNGMFRFWIHRFHEFRLLSRIMLIFWNCHNRPSEALSCGCGGLQAALQASPSLAWSCPQYAVSDGGFGDCKRTVPLQSQKNRPFAIKSRINHSFPKF